jgi:micrococcal nuclease
MAGKILGTRRKPIILGVIITVLYVAYTLANTAGWFHTAQQNVAVSSPGQYTVSRFVDGDTVAVIMNGHEEKLRLVGVDTPETHKPNTPVQCYGPAASAYTKNTLTNQKIHLESDELSSDRDKYGRLLRYIILSDGRNFNEMLVQNGYAFYYPYFPFTKSDAFAADQAAAMAAKRGVWGNCSPTKTDKGGYISNNQ